MRDIAAEYPSYSDLIASTDIKNLLQVDDNDYQGDSRVLVRDGARYGLLTFGWGSCSGCDALQAAESQAEIYELRDQLYGQIHWEDSAADLLVYIDGKDWSLDFRGDDAAGVAFRARVREILIGQVDDRALGAGR